MKQNSQSRKYQLTINNPLTYGIDKDYIVRELSNLSLNYYCFATEIASTGTIHTHIFLYSESPIRFSTIYRRFENAHIEKSYGTVKENRDYILKSGKWENTEKAETRIENSFYEWGDIPTEGREKAPAMAQLIEWVSCGMTTAQIIQQNPKYAFRIKDIDTLRQTILSERYMQENRHITVTYIYGETATGKTSSIYQSHASSDICRITTYKGDRVLYDDYRGQLVLCYDEFHSQIPITEMLNYLDIYPLMLPARYNDKVACYTQVYILSNIPLERQYTYEQIAEKATWNAFVRRITSIKKQISFGEQIELNKEDFFK